MDIPKMVVETLAVAQTAVAQLPEDYKAGRTRAEHIEQLQRLIDHFKEEDSTEGATHGEVPEKKERPIVIININTPKQPVPHEHLWTWTVGGGQMCRACGAFRYGR